MLASEVINAYEAFCPQEFSMEGDSRGLQIGTLDNDIQSVMVALDIREETVAEAIEKGVNFDYRQGTRRFSVRSRIWWLAVHKIRFTLISSNMTSQFMSAIPY